MADLKLDSNGDLLISNGLVYLTKDTQESLGQRLKIQMQTIVGEWYLDTSFGVPYFETIFKKGTPINYVDSIFKKIILTDTDVVSLDSFESSIENRIYTLNFKATTTNNITLVFSDQFKLSGG